MKRFVKPQLTPPVKGGFGELLKKSDAENTSICIRPLGELYVHQLMSLATALAYLRKRRNSTLRLDISDLDFDLQRGEKFLPYSKDPSSEETVKQIRKLISQFPELEERVEIVRFSGELKDPDFKNYILSVFENGKIYEIKRIIAGGQGNKQKIPFVPICPKCNHANATFGIFREDRFTVKGICKKEECENYKREFEIQLAEIPEMCFFYLLDSVGDGFSSRNRPKTTMHFSGMDLERVWGGSKIPIWEALGRLTAQFTKDEYSPEYYHGLDFEEVKLRTSGRAKTSEMAGELGITQWRLLEILMDNAEKWNGAGILNKETIKLQIR